MSPGSTLMKRLSVGEQVYKSLSNGIFSIYKPPDLDLLEISKKIKFNLMKGINELPCRPIQKIVKFDNITNEPFIGRNYADGVEGISRKIRLILF